MRVQWHKPIVFDVTGITFFLPKTTLVLVALTLRSLAALSFILGRRWRGQSIAFKSSGVSIIIARVELSRSTLVVAPRDRALSASLNRVTARKWRLR